MDRLDRSSIHPYESLDPAGLNQGSGPVYQGLVYKTDQRRSDPDPPVHLAGVQVEADGAQRAAEAVEDLVGVRG